jgi:hypothetical protein
MRLQGHLPTGDVATCEIAVFPYRLALCGSTRANSSLRSGSTRAAVQSTPAYSTIVSLRMLAQVSTQLGAPFTPAQLLTTLLTTESLLFAGLSATVALATPTDRGRALPTGGFPFGLFITAVITLASTGAGSVWWHLFSGGFPGNLSTALATSALATVIIAEPICALWAAFALRGT